MYKPKGDGIMIRDNSVRFVKPSGFDEHYQDILADCVAQGIVEKAIKRLHMRRAEANSGKEEVEGGSEKPA